MILARFTVTDVGPIVDGQSDVELRSDDDYFYISFRRPASDNVMKGQEFILQSFEVAISRASVVRVVRQAKQSQLVAAA